MEAKVIHIVRESISRIGKSGFRYQDHVSKEKDIETWRGSEDEIFNKFYKKNQELKYCNGHYYKFADSAIQKQYKEWIDKNYNISFYIKHGGDMW